MSVKRLDKKIERLMKRIKKLRSKQRHLSVLRDQMVAGTVPKSGIQLFLEGIKSGEIFGRRVKDA